MSRLIGVNTLVFNEELQEGTKKQWEYFSELKELGFPFVEVRREFFRDMELELKETKQHAEKQGLALFYSIPDVLFIANHVNERLHQYFEEAGALGSSQVKLTLGEFHAFDEANSKSLQNILEQYPDCKLTIENDQSLKGGSAERLSRFVAEAHQRSIPLALTFDTGNFVFIDENPETSARILQDFVNYIHIKNVRVQGENEIDLALYETGDVKMKPVLQAFKENVVAAIEYPCGSKEESMKVLRNQLDLIQQD